MNEVDEEGLSHRTDMESLTGFGQRRRRGVMVTSAAVIALGLSLGGGAVAGAGTTSTAPSAASGSSGLAGSASAGGRLPMPGSPPAAMGTVASVGDGTFTLTTTDNKTVTVDVSSSTTYRDPGVTSPTLANVTVGEHVAVFGTEASEVVTAASVAIGTPPGGGGPGGPGGRRGWGGTPPDGGRGGSTSTSTSG